MFQSLNVMADTRFVILSKLLASCYRGCISFWSVFSKYERFQPDDYVVRVYTDRSPYDQKRVQTARQLLNMFPVFSQRKFSNIVTGDETWIPSLEPVRQNGLLNTVEGLLLPIETLAQRRFFIAYSSHLMVYIAVRIQWQREKHFADR